MPIYTHNLETLYRGDSREYNLNFTDSKGEAIPINNWKIYFTMKLSYVDDDSKAVIKKDVTVHYDPENGKTTIALSHEDTDIVPENYWYDIQIKKSDGTIITLVRGRIEITTDITRRVD